ncbi:MAG: hypothetical protein JWQ81_5538 [Amycolatopsis sp.]|jgi:hypothetical protein|nr:hypothetical protein [Amycolatopsis sp.]
MFIQRTGCVPVLVATGNGRRGDFLAQPLDMPGNARLRRATG